MSGMICAGAVHYSAVPAKAFDNDWMIGREPALRWFSRADHAVDRLTDHKACGAPVYDSQRQDHFSRTDYLDWAYNDERCFTTSGCYFSPNLFYRWRNQKQLTGLCANWIEIDTAGHLPLTEEAAESLLAEVGKTLWTSGLPLPTSIVTTGSGGVHLYWMYDAPEMSASQAHREAMIAHWRLLNTTLVERLEAQRHSLGYCGWAVDRTASNNPSGVMRLVGSAHGKTGRTVTYYQGGEWVAFSQFAKQLSLKAEAPRPEQFKGKVSSVVQCDLLGVVQRGKSKASSRPHKARSRLPAGNPMPTSAGRAQGYDSAGQRHILRTIMQQWEDHLAQTGSVAKGQRDLTAFHLFNCARRVMDPEAAWEYIQTLNARYIQLPQQMLERYLSTAKQKVYFYALSTLKRVLADELGITVRVAASKKRLSASQRTGRQARAGRHTSRQLRDTTLTHLMEAGRELMRAGVRVKAMTKAQVLKASQVSRATLYRYWDRLTQTLQREEVISFSELKEVLQTQCLNRSPYSYNATGEAPLIATSVGSSGAGFAAVVRASLRGVPLGRSFSDSS